VIRRALVAVFLALVVLSAHAASVRFLNPGDGAQVMGVTLLEVTTDAADVDRVEFFIDGTLAGVVRTPPYRLSYDFGMSLQPHHIVAHVRSQRFRQDDVAEMRTAAVGGETITVNLVEVPLRIQAPGTVTAKDLTLVEDGVKQTIRDLFPDRPSSRFVFLVDRSQSMGEGKLTAALAAIDAALELLRPGDRAQIIFFNHNFGQLEELSRNAPATRFADVQPSGGTSLRDALVSSVADERTNTIILTDGGDRNSEITDEAALRRISGANNVYFTLVFDRASRFLEKAAENTGGLITKVSAATVREAMRALIADINSRHTLTYQSSGKKKGWRDIRITSTRSGVKVTKARKGYFAE
jgi:von Willebrand factor type A domain/Bacterial Ig domain